MPNNAPTSSIFLKKPTETKGVPVRRTGYKCSGINCCEYSAASIRTPHTSWTIKDWEDKQANTHTAQQMFMDEWHPWIGQEATLTLVKFPAF